MICKSMLQYASSILWIYQEFSNEEYFKYTLNLFLKDAYKKELKKLPYGNIPEILVTHFLIQ